MRHRTRATSESSPRLDLRPDGGRVGNDDLAGLLRTIARGDLVAFEALYDTVSPLVYGVVRRTLRDPFQSEEVTQEVLVEIWRLASRYDPSKGSVLAWVSTLAHRRAVDRVRSEQRAVDRVARASAAGEGGAQGEDVAITVEARLVHDRVRRCMDRLTDVQRESLILAYYGGHSYREVAELLGAALGTVNTRMRDGLIRLRDCLGVEA